MFPVNKISALFSYLLVYKLAYIFIDHTYNISIPYLTVSNFFNIIHPYFIFQVTHSLLFAFIIVRLVHVLPSVLKSFQNEVQHSAVFLKQMFSGFLYYFLFFITFFSVEPYPHKPYPQGWNLWKKSYLLLHRLTPDCLDVFSSTRGSNTWGQQVMHCSEQVMQFIVYLLKGWFIYVKAEAYFFHGWPV